MARPATPFTWATDPGAVVTEPSAQRKADGWIAGLIPPADYWNWLLQHIAEWIGFLETAPAVYATLEAAYADTVAGDLCIVDEKDLSAGSSPGAEDWNGIAVTADILSVCSTGRGVVYARTAILVEVERSDPTTVVKTYVKTIAGNIVRVITDGNFVYITTGRYLEAFRCDTAASVWTVDLGATVTIADIAICRNRLLCGGADSGAGVNVFCRNAATGAAYWSFNHGAAVFAVAASGARAFIAGAISGYASACTLRALVLDSGAALTNEGGASVDATFTAWNVIQPNAQIRHFTLATDGRHLYCGHDNTSAVQIEVRGCADGIISSSRTIAGLDVQCLSVDQGLLVASGIGGSSDYTTVCMDKKSLATSWRYANTLYDHTCNVADGTGVFIGRGAIGIPAIPALIRRHRGNRPTLYRRVDYTVDNDFSPVAGALTPSME